MTDHRFPALEPVVVVGGRLGVECSPAAGGGRSGGVRRPVGAQRENSGVQSTRILGLDTIRGAHQSTLRGGSA